MLLRFDPFREVDRFVDQVDRAWNRPGASLPMDAVRTDSQVRISFDIPGVSPDDIDLTVERDVLTIAATRRVERGENDEVLVSEPWRGTLSRRVLLGESLDTSQLEASYDQGVLTLTIPVAEQAKPRKVPIEGKAEKAAIDTSSKVA